MPNKYPVVKTNKKSLSPEDKQKREQERRRELGLDLFDLMQKKIKVIQTQRGNQKSPIDARPQSNLKPSQNNKNRFTTIQAHSTPSPVPAPAPRRQQKLKKNLEDLVVK